MYFIEFKQEQVTNFRYNILWTHRNISHFPFNNGLFSKMPWKHLNGILHWLESLKTVNIFGEKIVQTWDKICYKAKILAFWITTDWIEIIYWMKL